MMVGAESGRNFNFTETMKLLLRVKNPFPVKATFPEIT